MYELIDKKIKNKFNETKYGKKTNKMFLIASINFVIIILLFATLYYLNLKNAISINDDLINIGKYILFIVAILVCYFDGKRDGAIEMFKNIKKK